MRLTYPLSLLPPSFPFPVNTSRHTPLARARPCIRGDNANRNKHLAARERHVAARIYYIPNAHTLDERLKGCCTREEPRS